MQNEYNGNEQNNEEDEIVEEVAESVEAGPEEGEAESSPANEKQEPQEECKYKEGQMLTFVRVRFPKNAKSFPFLVGNKKYNYGQRVVAMSDRGMTVGYINSVPYEAPFNKSMLPVRTISKLATEEDLLKQKQNIDAERNAGEICIRLIDKHKLDMNLTHVELLQFGKKAVFYFTAPARVDFRNLVKDLVTELRMKIELRQITIRDRAAALGAVAGCGLQTCCTSFLKNYGNVSIKMAKNQNLTLLPGKINGCCGQIKCCIKYENEVYAEKRKKLPKENSFIRAVNGDMGKILKLNVLEEEFEMLTSEGKKRRYTSSQFNPESSKLPEGWKFPEMFDHIINETSTLIGQKNENDGTSCP